MTEKPIIRPYHASDKENIIALLRLNTPKFFSPEEENDLIYYLDYEIEEYDVICIADKIIGSGGINYQENQSIGCISWDLMHPAYQGQGFGTLLLKLRLSKLLANPKKLKIIVRTSQLVYKFYEKAGFQLTLQVKDYWAKDLDLCKMEYVR